MGNEPARQRNGRAREPFHPLFVLGVEDVGGMHPLGAKPRYKARQQGVGGAVQPGVEEEEEEDDEGIDEGGDPAMPALFPRRRCAFPMR